MKKARSGDHPPVVPDLIRNPGVWGKREGIDYAAFGNRRITTMTVNKIEPVELVRLVHGSPTRVCAVVTGGGVLSLAWLFGEPGASRTFLDAQIPYSMRALDGYVGVDAEQHVSPVEADRMAQAALARGQRLAESVEGIAGVSCTATIATDRPKRGEHRCAIAWASVGGSAVYSLTLVKGARGRAGEEEVVSRLFLNTLAEACGVAERVDLLLVEGESVVTHRS